MLSSEAKAQERILNAEYSKEELIKFLHFIRDKDLVRYQTATSWVTAVSKLLSDLSDEENTDVRRVDIELAVHKAANRKSHNISPSSLKAYRARTKRAIEEFVKWREDPANYRPLSFTKSQQTGNSTSSSKQKQKSISSKQSTKANSENHSEEVVSNSSELNLSYPLRSDFLAQVVIPRDLSHLEAKRLGAFILTLATDYQPE